VIGVRERAARTGPPSGRTGVRAVVVDEWPLVRMGLGVVLQEAGVGVVGDSDRGSDGVRLAADSGADLLVLGLHADLPLPATVRRAKRIPTPPRVLVLYGAPDRSEILELLELEVEGLVGRLSPPPELQAAVTRVVAGERVVGGAAVAVLADAVRAAGLTQPEPTAEAPGPLTVQEGRVLDRLAVGLSNAEIAVELSVSVATVKTHLSNLYGKLEASNRREAVVRGIDLGLVGVRRP
jgi:DNA-binding NarL/FixJ family response regulator